MQRGVEPVFWWPKNLKCTKCYCSISALYCFRQYNADHSYSDQWHHLHWYFYLWCHWSEPPCLYKKQSTRAMTSCWTQLSSSSSSFFLFFFFFLSTFTLTIFSTLWYNSKSYWQVIYIYIYMGLGAGVAYLFFPQTAWQKIYYVYWCQFRGEFVNCNAKKGCILDTISTGFDLFFFLWLNISITF